MESQKDPQLSPILKKRSAGVFFTKDDCILLGHATDTDHWDIPKGGIDGFESIREAAIRECFEETGFVVRPDQLKMLPLMPYSDKKDVYVYRYIGGELPEIENLKCTSFCLNKRGETIPEMDKFEWVKITELKNYLRPHMLNFITGYLFMLEMLDIRNPEHLSIVRGVAA